MCGCYQGCLREYNGAVLALQSILLFIDLKKTIAQTIQRAGTTSAIDLDPCRQCSAYTACTDGLGREQLY